MDSYVVAACIALFGVFVSITGSYITNERITKKSLDVQKELAKENINANLVAKARIEWIQNVRKDSSKLISALYNFTSHSYSVAVFMNSTGSSIREPKVNENIDKIDIYQLTISEYTEKLKLYFPIQDSDGKNKNVVETILEANKSVLNKRGSNQSFRNFDFSFLTEDPERYVIESEKSINNLSNVISSYLKEEWNKSKTGK
jgi:hypothetical protein